MVTLNPTIDLDAFFARLARARERVLLLDYDGTLAPFEPDRDAVRLYDGVDRFLQRWLHDAACRVVFVSGRGARDLAQRLPGAMRPEIWGAHGAERLQPDGTWTTLGIPPAAGSVLAAERGRVERSVHRDWFEVKARSIALHVRGRSTPEASTLLNATRSHWSRLDAAGGLRVHEFDGGIELKVAGADKGSAVTTLLGELGSGAVVAYLGDDATDEDAFVALRNRGLSVLVRPELRPTAADLWLVPPHELLEFLARWDRAVRAGEACG